MLKRVDWLIILLVIGLVMPQLVWAQEEEKEFIEEETRAKLETTQAFKSDVLYDYGGWWKNSTYLFNDPDRERTMRAQDIRIWGKALIKDLNNFYIRIKAISVDYNKGDGYLGNDNYWIKPRLDQGFYKIKLFDTLYSPKVELLVGRQYMYLGSGLVYGRVDDGVRIDVRHVDFSTRIIAAQTVRSISDIDRSRPGRGDSHRSFFGLQIDYQVMDRHQPYIFFLNQNDNNRENPENTTQEYDYNSEYLGLGIRGTIKTGLEYAAEFIRETGTSYANGAQWTTSNIRASGTLLHLRYLSPSKFSPRITVRYLHGSGDSDRGSVTNTAGGNQFGTDDKNFMYFGYALTGYVLGSKISNLHVYNVLVSIKPVEYNKTFKDTELGLGLYWYHKEKRNGAISDSTATLNKKDVGNEIDLYFNWKVFYDLSVSARGGWFFPQDAYSDNVDETATFWGMSLTYAF